VVVDARPLAGQYRLLSEVAGRAEPGSDRWCTMQCWLGRAALVASDMPGALGHLTAVCEAAETRGPSGVLAETQAGRSVVLLNMAGSPREPRTAAGHWP
jgi:hypothetical protein